MTIQRKNSLLWAGCGAMSLAAIAVLAGGAIVPPKAPSVAPIQLGGKAMLATTRPSTLSSNDFALVLTRSFRGAPTAADGSAAATVAASDAAQPSQIQLIGTIGTSLAILRGPDGTEALAEVGDDVNGDAVVAVRSAEVDLRSAGGTITTLRQPTAPDESLPR